MILKTCDIPTDGLYVGPEHIYFQKKVIAALVFGEEQSILVKDLKEYVSTIETFIKKDITVNDALAYTDLKEEKEYLEGQLRDYESEVDDLQEEVEEKQEEIWSLEREITGLESDIATLEMTNSELQEKISSLEEKIDELKKDVRYWEEQYDKMYDDNIANNKTISELRERVLHQGWDIENRRNSY